MPPIPAPGSDQYEIKIPIPMPGPFHVGGGVVVQTNPVAYSLNLTGKPSNIRVYISQIQKHLEQALREVPS